MKTPWFRRFGVFFIPSTVPGVVIALAAAGVAVCVFLFIDRHSHSVSDTLINLIVPFAVIMALYSFLALATSVRRGDS